MPSTIKKFTSVFKKKPNETKVSVSKDFYDPSSAATSSSNSAAAVQRNSKVLNQSTWYESPQSIGNHDLPARTPPEPPMNGTHHGEQVGMFGYYAPVTNPNTDFRALQHPPAELGQERTAVSGHVMGMPDYLAYRPASDDRARAEENARRERAAAQERIRQQERQAGERERARREQAAAEERLVEQKLAAQRAKQRKVEEAEEKAKQEQLAAEEVLGFRRTNAGMENIRHVRGLIREKYRLDIKVWNKKHVQVALRPKIEEDMRKADAILEEIISIVGDWDADVFQPDEWDLAEEIKNGIPKLNDPFVLWRTSPPWDPARLETESADEDVRD